MSASTSSNAVILEGRISGVSAKTMPSGDQAVSFRVIVDRAARDRGPTGRVSVDTLDCIAWRADVQRRVERFEEGATVRVEGALRRRFWHTGAGPASRVEVEVRRVTSIA